MLRLKKIERSEVSAVVPLFLGESQTRFWEDGRSHDRQSATEMLGAYFLLPSHHWIMFWSGDVAGYGHVLRSDYLGAWIVSYLVHPKFQGQGMATAFVEEAKRFAETEGMGSLYASIHPENVASIRVAERSGFQLTEQRTNSGDRLYRWPSQPLA